MGIANAEKWIQHRQFFGTPVQLDAPLRKLRWQTEDHEQAVVGHQFRVDGNRTERNGKRTSIYSPRIG